jgi:hypothetical protein
MQFRVRLSVLEPSGVNMTTIPETVSWPGRVLSREDEVVPVRVVLTPGENAGENNYTVLNPAGAVLEAGAGYRAADAARIASSTKLRRIVLVIEANEDAIGRLRGAADAVGQQIATGGRSFVGANVRALPARAGTGLGVVLGLLGLFGLGYYINKD